MTAVEQVASELTPLQRYRYVVERYIVSLKQLTVAAYPLEEPGKPVFITFRTVSYMQMPTYWQEAPFKLSTPDECRTFLERVGLDAVDELPHLFSARPAKSEVYIVCRSLKVSETMPS